MMRGDWLYELNGLLVRFSGMGMNADLAALSLCELWGIYCYLRRLAESQGA